MSRRASYALLAAALSAGAPVGLCLLRSAKAGQLSAAWVRGEVAGDLSTYLYVLVSTGIVFSICGFVIGRQVDRLKDLSHTDALTGLRNRRYFQERLEEEFARAARYDTPLSLLLIDLDGLKELNDSHGHRAGDLALRHAAGAIRSGSRGSDIGARWGGDEFVLLAPNTGREEAHRLAERVRALASAEAARAAPHAVTVSVGVTTLDAERPLRSPEALVRAADGALYEAKRAGRNRVIAG